MRSKAKDKKEKPSLTAEEYRLRAQTHRLASAKQWKIFWRTGIFFLAALIVLVVIAVAWFASNDRVNATAMKINADSSNVELRSEGVDPDVELSDGTGLKVSAILKAISKGKLEANNQWTAISELLFSAQTDPQHTRVNWLLGPESGFDEILPGASGVLTFYVRADHAMDVNLSMDIKCYSATDQETSIPVEIEVSEETKTWYLTESDQIAQNLVKGHILFFEPVYETDENGAFVLDEAGNRIVSEKYGTLLNDQAEGMTLSPVTISQNQADNEEWVPVNVYWMWPLSFGQMILPDGAVHLKTFGKKGLFPETIRDQLKDDMAANKASYFYDSTWYDYPEEVTKDEDKTAYTAGLMDQAVTEEQLSAMRTENYSYAAHSEYSYYYNYGDQYIGTNVDYIVVSVTAQ